MTVRDENTRACDPAREDTTLRIRALNNALRRLGQDGTLAVTNGVVALGEHDFGAFDWNGHRLF